MSDRQTERFVAALEATRGEPRQEFVVSLGHRLRAEATSEADPSIGAIEDYLGDEDMTTLETDQRADESRPSYRWPLGIAAAVLLVVAVGAAVLLATRDDDGAVPPTQAGVTVDSAFAVTDAYFATYNAGDADGVLALFADDATFSDSLLDHSRPYGWDLDLVWRLAQGEKLSSQECTLVEEIPGTAVTISCVHETADAPIQESGKAAVLTTTTMIVTAAGISDLTQLYDGAHFMSTGNRFNAWMRDNHPEDAEAAACCAGSTVEESVARGELRAEYAKLWAAQLEN